MGRALCARSAGEARRAATPTKFYGNLYHLNAEEEPELPDYPKDPEFRKKFGPRGVIHSFANGKIEDTGPLTKKRMETIDDDIAARSAKHIEDTAKANKPMFATTIGSSFSPSSVRRSIDHAFLLVPAQAYVAKFMATFKDFPPRQKAASFVLDRVMDQLSSQAGSH